MKTKIFVVIILICVVLFGVYVFFAQKSERFSEEPNKEVFDAYFSSAYVGKVPVIGDFDPEKRMVKTKEFSQNDKFCISFNIKKEIPNGNFVSGTYSIENKNYFKEKTIFPGTLKIGNTTGCEMLTSYPIGRYEEKVFIDGVLAIVLPFNIR